MERVPGGRGVGGCVGLHERGVAGGSGVSEARPLIRSPKQLALVIAVFVVILGVPVGLFLYVGRWLFAVGFVAAWVVMVVASGLFLWKAAEEVRGSNG